MTAPAPVRPVRALEHQQSGADARSMVGRISTILDAFSPIDGALSIGELSRRTHLPKSTVSRIVIELVAHRMLERDGRDLRLGMRMFEIGEAVRKPHHLRRVAAVPLASLRRSLDLTSHLAILEWPEVLFLEVLPARQRVFPTFRSRVARMPAHATAVGKAMLAWSPDFEARTVRTPMTRVTPHTITSPERLHEELVAVRRNGFAVECGESRIGAVCIAAPVLDSLGRPVAALSVTGRDIDVDVNRVAPLVIAAAAAASRGFLLPEGRVAGA